MMTLKQQTLIGAACLSFAAIMPLASHAMKFPGRAPGNAGNSKTKKGPRLFNVNGDLLTFKQILGRIFLPETHQFNAKPGSGDDMRSYQFHIKRAEEALNAGKIPRAFDLYVEAVSGFWKDKKQPRYEGIENKIVNAMKRHQEMNSRPGQTLIEQGNRALRGGNYDNAKQHYIQADSELGNEENQSRN